MSEVKCDLHGVPEILNKLDNRCMTLMESALEMKFGCCDLFRNSVLQGLVAITSLFSNKPSIRKPARYSKYCWRPYRFITE